MTKDPEMFTINVPHGNVSPNLFATSPDAPQRARLPNPPPTNIHSAFHINSDLANFMALVGVISTELFQAVFPVAGGRQTPLPEAGYLWLVPLTNKICQIAQQRHN
jgi:hypothetical protein